MRNVSDEAVETNKNTFFIQYLFFENLAVYEKMWKNIVELDRPQMTIRHVRIAYWITKSTHTRNVAFPLKQLLHERASLLYLFTYFACLVFRDIRVYDVALNLVGFV